MNFGVAFFILFHFQTILIQAAHEFQAHRLLQFDKNGLHYGSRRAVVNHLGVPLTNLNLTTNSEDTESGATDKKPRSGSKDLARRIVVAPFASLSPALLKEAIDVRGAAGLLIVLPVEFEFTQEQKWQELDRYFFSRAFEIPVYFAVDSEELREVYQDLNAQDQSIYQFVVSTTEPSAITSLTSYNYQGWVYSSGPSSSSGSAAGGTGGSTGASPNAAVKALPTIALVAHYDTFSSVPGLAHGEDDNGSGVIALLEAARVFAGLYRDARNQGQYNLLFVLTGMGRLNYEGTKRWLAIDSRVLESLSLALCLDSVGTSKSLYLHVSKLSKSPEINQLLANIQESVSNGGGSVEVVSKKINVSNPIVHWHHEQFAKKRIPAATLSNRPTPTEPFTVSTHRSAVDPVILRHNINLIIDVLAKQIYGVSGKQLELAVNNGAHSARKEAISAYLSLFSKFPRMGPFTEPTSAPIAAIEQALGRYCGEVKKTSFVVESSYKFYSGAVTVSMSAYRVKPISFHLLLSLAITAYLSLLYIAFRGWKEVRKEITGIFITEKKRK